jgi:hypothetical protein
LKFDPHPYMIPLMRWIVEGADAETGKESRLTFDALSEAEAAALARSNGFLVSKVYPAGTGGQAPGLNYSSPARPVIPYEVDSEVQGGARRLRWIAPVLGGAGVLAVAYGVIRVGLLVANVAQGGVVSDPVAAVAGRSLPIILGLFLLAFSGLLRIAASLAPLIRSHVRK